MDVEPQDRLFRELAYLGPTDAAELAGAVGLDQGVVQDWLDAQLAAGACHFSALTARYWLSPDQATHTAKGDSDARSRIQ